MFILCRFVYLARFRFVSFFLSTAVALEQICNCGYYVYLERGRGSGDRNLTHCWPHDKRWLVNKSKAKANVSSLSLSLCPCYVSCCSSSSLQNVRKFLFATCNSLWQGLSRCLGPSGQVACNMIGHCTQLSAAAQHSTGYSYFICPVDL